MVERLVEIIFGIILPIPLLLSLPYLLKIMLESKRKDAIGKFVFKLLLCVLLTIIAIFLIFEILISFIFINVEIPKALEILGLLLFMLYYLCFASILYSFGMLGHGGVSPGNVLRELYKELVKKEGS